MGVALYILALCLLILALYKLFYDFDYWKKRGVKYVKPVPFFGNFLDVFAFRTTMGHMLAELYRKMEAPFFGIFVLNKPYLILKDPEVIKTILVKDFDNFCDRNMVSDEKLDPVVSKMLFVIKNPEWKNLHVKFSPLFTPTKLRNMSGLMNNCGEEMNLYLERNSMKEFIDAKELCAKFATEVIASCAFGINAHCFQHEDAQFRQIGRKIYGFTWKNAISQLSYFMAPKIVKLFKLPFIDFELTGFMKTTFWQTMREREEKNYKRNDLIDIMIQIKNEHTSLDEDTVLAQAVVFFIGGSDTSGTAMSFALYELCIHPEIQDKLRLEIQSHISEKGFTYEAVQEMKYLTMVILETLRKYTSPPFLDRICTKDYKIPGSDVIIEKDTAVLVPLLGLHYDSKYFPDPERFVPERFTEENKQKLGTFVHLPFGEGPRGCIGQRFAMLSIKLGIARILSEFKLEACDRTPIPIEFDTKSLVLAPKYGLPMKFKKL